MALKREGLSKAVPAPFRLDLVSTIGVVAGATGADQARTTLKAEGWEQTAAVEGPAKTLALVCAPIITGSRFCFGALYSWRAGRRLQALFPFANLQGQPQTPELKVRSRAWHMLREGGAEAITCLTEQPERAELGPKWGRQLLGWVSPFSFLAAGSTVVIGFVLLMRLLTGKLEPVKA